MGLDDLGFYQSQYLQIVDKSGQIRPFAANHYQQQLNRLVDSRRGQPLRVIILKCRQIGASTWGASYIYHRTATQFHKSGLIIADSDENSTGLFEKCKSYYAWSPDPIKPKKRYSNEKALVFDNPDANLSDGLGSKISVATAGNLSAGRSKTIQYLHASEFAYWANAGQLATGLFQSVPIVANTGIIIESTANGVGGKGEEFYNRCMKALDGDTAFDFLFFDWKDNPEYRLPVPQDFRRTPEEENLARLHKKYTDAMFMFRRYKIHNELGTALVSPEDQWNQEYPDSPEVAFISSGRPVFSAEKIHVALSRARQTKVVKGRFDASSFVEDGRGNLSIFKPPKQGEVYSIGADIAEGLEGGDYSTASVVNKDLEQVAVYHGHIDPDQFGAFLVRLGRYYNNALLAPEVNNHGHATLAAIKNLSYHWVYRREVKEELGQEVTDKVGWQTNTKTKMVMLDGLVAAFRDDSTVINDDQTLREMMTLSIEEDGDISLNSKDRVVAHAIALQAIKQVGTPNLKAYVPSRKIEKDVTKMTLEQKLKYYKTRER